MGKKRKLNWKPVALPASVIANGVDDLIAIEELHDYCIGDNEIVTSESSPKKQKHSIGEEIFESDETISSKSAVAEKHNSGMWMVSSIHPQEERSEQNCTQSPKRINTKRRKTKQNVQCTKYTAKSLNTSLKVASKNQRDVDSALNVAPNIPIGSHRGNYSGNNILDGMEAWSSYNIPLPVLKALSELGFQNPTQIQELTLPSAIMGRRDILGAAETGSGKTLAFGIPIIYGILQQQKKDASTGEQNIQKCEDKSSSDEFKSTNESLVKKSMKTLETSEDVESDEESIDSLDTTNTSSSGRKLYALILTPTRELAIQVQNHLVAVAKYTDIRIATVVGGLAPQKQERLLKKCPEIVVATPGRLWEMIQSGNSHLEQVCDIRFLAIDETDRMLEKGHFQELQSLLQRINLDEFKKKKRQNFVFSATLTMVHEPPKYAGKLKTTNRITPGQKLQKIISSLGITNPKVVDITAEKGTASTLREARIVCTITEKDYYLYYFLLRHTGRTLVFCNSISCVRRITQILQILQCNPYPLHANMQQRQRLKNLERFRDNPNGLLLATDVAARGLDIPNVEHVIHYQVPRTTESYVHRSGRTARAQKEGITILLMEANEVPYYLRVCKSLAREHDLPDFPVEDRVFSSAKVRVNVALQIDKLEHTTRRSSSQQGWFEKAAKEMDILLDEDDIPNKTNNKATAQIKRQINGLRKQLQNLLSKSIISKSASRFPNQNIKNTDQASAIAVVKESKKRLGAFMKVCR